ncbi:uncharacterized protein LOC128861670 [Anastrepha ludens]|uniref:uncharacterized protein LOC128861670 n=1 Tax=Anastrepha ludens TaxID=28586 RepID=UPI0023B03544|nr:uncharacterized protein LOC128861670 [Anastrepha ludens]
MRRFKGDITHQKKFFNSFAFEIRDGRRGQKNVWDTVSTAKRELSVLSQWTPKVRRVLMANRAKMAIKPWKTYSLTDISMNISQKPVLNYLLVLTVDLKKKPDVFVK